MKKLIIVSLATLLTGTPLLAADMAAPVYKAPEPIATWTGFYFGADGGYGLGYSSTTATYFGPPAFLGGPAIPNQAFSQTSGGAVFGGYLGYNWQIQSSWLIGVEGDFNGSGISQSTQIVKPDPLGGAGGLATDGFSQDRSIQWLASIRGRLGYTLGPNLFYVTGGGAWEGLKNNDLVSADTSLAVFSQSVAVNSTTVRTGWVAGAGFEHLIGWNWIVRAEYLHYGFGSDTATATFNPPQCNFAGVGTVCGQNITNTNNHVDVVRLGLGYKF